MYILGLDLGQQQDPTAMGLIRVEKTRLALPYLDRLPLRTPYTEIIPRVRKIVEHPTLNGDVHLVVDATGVGRAVVDMFREAGLNPIALTITGGDRATEVDGEYRVPKRDLVGVLQAVLQSEELKVSDKLPLAQVLVAEMMNFRAKISLSGHDSYEAWRSGDHDDLVLAVSMAVWLAKHVGVARLGGLKPQKLMRQSANDVPLVSGTNAQIFNALYEDDDFEMDLGDLA